jgi:hypothetical protein
MLRFVCITIAVAIMSGCAYQVPAINVSAPNVYTTYENRIPGSYVLLIDDSVTSVSRQMKASGHVCSAHTYPIFLGDSAGTSVKKLMESLFDNMTVVSSMPTTDEMKRNKVKGALVVKLDTFEPRFSCQMGLFSGTCTASADVAFGLIANGPAGRLVAFSSSGSKTADGGAGGACEGASVVLGDAISKSMKDALERMGERIANSPTLRAN